MSRFHIVCAWMVLWCILPVCFLADERPATQWNAEGTVLTVAAPSEMTERSAEKTVKATPAIGGVFDRLGLLERWRLGLTIRNVGDAAKKAVEEGRITPDMPNSVAAAVIAQDLVAANGEAYFAAAGRDWAAFFEQLLAFLEKILPLILPFII